MDCSPPGSSIHGTFQARILEWVAISYSRESSSARNQTCVSCVSQMAVRFFTTVLPQSVQSLSHVQLFVTPWIAACQASLPITNSWSLLKLMPIESLMSSNHLSHPLSSWEAPNKLVQFSSVAQSCPTLCDPMDCSLPGSSVHEIFQARGLEWVAISFSRGSSRPRDWTRVSRVAGRHFTIWATREVKKSQKHYAKQYTWCDSKYF